MNSIKRVGSILGFCLAFVVVSGFMSTASAERLWSWTDDTPVVEDAVGTSGPSYESNMCYLQYGPTAEVGDRQIKGRQVTDDITTSCMIGEGANYQLYGYIDGSNRFAIQFAGDTYPYAIHGISCTHKCIYMPSRDMLLSLEVSGDAYPGRIAVYKDFVYNLERRKGGALTFDSNYYQFTQTVPDEYLNDVFDRESGIGYAYNFVKSKGDEWLIVEIANSGLYRIDMDTKEMVKFSNWKTPHQSGEIRVELDVTDDGKHVFASEFARKYSIYEIKDDCGVVLPANPTAYDVQLPASCPASQVGAALKEKFVFNNFISYSSQFSANGGELSFYVVTDNEPTPWTLVTLRAASHASVRFDYLALGDSYASGEGDTEQTAGGERYYRPLTNTSRERCHISTRSYPYRLAEGMSLDASSWNTIACSGATAWDAKGQGSAAYLGQSDRLNGIGDTQTLKNQALNELIPGRHKQVEFVKKYKPKVITLTMGGNDIGFGDKLTGCVMYLTTCDYVGSKRGDIASAIAKQYTNLKSLYEELYRASGSQAKIYVVGYSNFINGDKNAKCGLNVGSLYNDEKERELIVSSVTYLNNVIKQAAKAAGVKYIDVQNSFDGHRLCDAGEKYVTGIVDTANISSNRQESFHPNANGHSKLAFSIWGNVWSDELGAGESLLDYDICPGSAQNICPDFYATKETIDVPDYFANVDSSKNIETKHITDPIQKKKSLLEILLGPFTFNPWSLVSIALHSDPISLGQHTAGDDGSLEVSVEVPQEISAGYHTLVVTGETYSGEAIEYEQTLLIKGADDNDIDENGVADSEDPCLFMAASGVDRDQDGIDDACDPTVIEPPVVSPSPSPSVTPTPSPTPDPVQGLNPLANLIKHIVGVVVQVVNVFVGVLQSLLKLKFW